MFRTLAHRCAGGVPIAVQVQRPHLPAPLRRAAVSVAAASTPDRGAADVRETAVACVRRWLRALRSCDMRLHASNPPPHADRYGRRPPVVDARDTWRHARALRACLKAAPRSQRVITQSRGSLARGARDFGRQASDRCGPTESPPYASTHQEPSRHLDGSCRPRACARSRLHAA
jgi:hypothetical protein